MLARAEDARRFIEATVVDVRALRVYRRATASACNRRARARAHARLTMPDVQSVLSTLTAACDEGGDPEAKRCRRDNDDSSDDEKMDDDVAHADDAHDETVCAWLAFEAFLQPFVDLDTRCVVGDVDVFAELEAADSPALARFLDWRTCIDLDALFYTPGVASELGLPACVVLAKHLVKTTDVRVVASEPLSHYVARIGKWDDERLGALVNRVFVSHATLDEGVAWLATAFKDVSYMSRMTPTSLGQLLAMPAITDEHWQRLLAHQFVGKHVFQIVHVRRCTLTSTAYGQPVFLLSSSIDDMIDYCSSLGDETAVEEAVHAALQHTHCFATDVDKHWCAVVAFARGNDVPKHVTRSLAKVMINAASSSSAQLAPHSGGRVYFNTYGRADERYWGRTEFHEMLALLGLDE